MNAQNAPKITKETKDKIRVEFERTSKKERMRIKYLSGSFVVSVVWWIFRFIILLGLAYVVLMPFFSKITGSFMSPEDFIDVTVKYIPKYPTLDTYKAIIAESKYGTAFINTIALSLFCGVTQTFICSLIGYGFAKFKFKGSMLLFLLVVLTMVIPHQTVMAAVHQHGKPLLSLLHFPDQNGVSIADIDKVQYQHGFPPLIVGFTIP
jgi:ABC-type glycerol-3-phosphate transport system permease component